jgi:hypothetical protein
MWAGRPLVGLVGLEDRRPHRFVDRLLDVDEEAPHLRTLAAANTTMLMVGTAAFGQFFIRTLHLQEVLRYSALKTGVAFVTITVALIAVTNLVAGL